MLRSILRFPILLYALVVVLLSACAQQGQPTGGPKDTAPPVMDTLRSTPNYRTRFGEKRIELTFNEWLKLKDVGQQVVISPPLAKTPQITLHGKMVRVDLGDNPDLRPNTTYTINFGNAIIDLHEGNPVKDLRFVFSTGDIIDSLRLTGRVVDVLTGEAIDNATVMLYDSENDTVITREKPYYFGKTDKTGQFTIQNIRAGSFKAIAIDEGTAPNLKWEDTEKIGFLPERIVLGDTTKPVQPPVFRLGKIRPKLRLINREATAYGVLKLGYTTTPDSVTVRTSSDIAPPNLKIEHDKDSILVWYDWPENTPVAAWQVIAGAKDTINIKALDRATFLLKHRVRLADEVPVVAGKSKGNRITPPPPSTLPQLPTGNVPKAPAPPTYKTTTQNPAQTARLTLNVPVISTDTARWVLLEDSVQVHGFSVTMDSVSPRGLMLNMVWKQNANYRLTLLPGAITGFYGVANTDTIVRGFNVLGEKQMGGLNLTLQSLKPGQAYVLQVMNGSAQETERRFVAKSTEERLIFTKMQTATYTLQLIEDSNANGRWDTGDYYQHRPAELIFVKKLEPLRANWEVEATMEAVAGGDKKDRLKKE